jgi:hypothetical protein
LKTKLNQRGKAMTEIKNQTYCPSDDELMQYKLGNSEKERFKEITEHLVTCDVCTRTILDFLPETEEEWQRLKMSGDENSGRGNEKVEDFLSANLIDNFEQLRQAAIRLENKRKDFGEIGLQGLRVGQIWRPKSDNIVLPMIEGKDYVSDFKLNSKNHFVIIQDTSLERVGNYNVIKVIPVDDKVSSIAENEIVIPAKFNPLERDLILQLWNEKEMLVENLESCFGEIAAEWVKTGQEKQHVTFLNGNFGIKELFAEFKKNLSYFAYESTNVIHQGLIPNPLYRYRTKEVAETNHLNFPVESLRYAEAQREVPGEIVAVSSSLTFLEQIKSVFSMSPSPAFVSAGNNSQSGWEEDNKTYFDGKLKCKRRKSVEGHNLLLLQSDDAEFANRLILLGKDEADLILALLTANNPIHQGYVSVLNFGESESPEDYYSNKVLKISELPKFNARLIQNSIAHVDEMSELLAWKELADAGEIDKNLSQIIHQAVKAKED